MDLSKPQNHFMKKLLFILSILFTALIFLSRCGPSSVVVRARPQPPVYVRPVAPGAGYIWVNGEWIRRGHGYALS